METKFKHTTVGEVQYVFEMKKRKRKRKRVELEVKKIQQIQFKQSGVSILTLIDQMVNV